MPAVFKESQKKRKYRMRNTFYCLLSLHDKTSYKLLISRRMFLYWVSRFELFFLQLFRDAKVQTLHVQR